MKSSNIINIDNNDFSARPHSTFSEAIQAHSRIAEFYRYRPPYLKKFFEVAREKLHISPQTALLDLCCGRGELASGFANFSGTIYGIDGSEKMLDHAIKKDNIVYQRFDVNNDEISLPQSVSHILVGSAIHWIKGDSLKRLTKATLRKGGLIFVTHTLLKNDDQPYSEALRKVNCSYGKKQTAVDLWGTETLQQCGYEIADTVRLSVLVEVSLDNLFKSQLSYLYKDFYDNVKADIKKYENDFRDSVSPYVVNGKLRATLINWGLIYKSVGV